uniref:Elongation factor Ts, mitochondrial n=1 Tax=Romanomermis culicivorax TaxID=13658 RepID=A0A915IJ15_ROMCU
MYKSMICRFYSTQHAKASVNKDALLFLRKATGFPLQNCRKAVEQFGEDLDAAQKWLRQKALEEGWSKMATVRKTAAGLIGLKTDEKRGRGLMLELNCETDFVAKNAKFQELTSEICRHILESNSVNMAIKASEMDSFLRKSLMMKEEASSLAVQGLENFNTIADLIASYVGQIGEKISLKRALYVETKSSECSLIGYAHPKSAPIDGVLMGQLGTIVAYGHRGDSNTFTSNAAGVDPKALGGMICQQIVGMNPKTLGTFVDGDVIQTSPLPKNSGAEETEESYENQLTKLDGGETELLKQDFLLQPEMKFGKFLQMNGAKVYDFVRFKCGEDD